VEEGKREEGGEPAWWEIKKAVLAQRSRWLLIWIFEAARETALHRDSTRLR